MNRLIHCFFLLTALLIASSLEAQELNCGTLPPVDGLPHLADLRSSDDSPLIMLVKVYMIRNDQGELPFGEGWVFNAIDAINTDLEEIGVELRPCGPPLIVDSTQLSYSDIGSFNQFAKSVETPGYLNIFLKQYSGLGNFAAYSQFPGGFDHMVFGTGGSTMQIAIHEIGHFLSLLHTHQGYSTEDAAEYVDGSNCETAGDLVCDTPASPDLSLSGMLDLDCNYTGELTDPLGAPYMPSTDNHMSYAYNSCRDNFSSGQYERMAGSRDALRFYMVQGEGSPGIYGLSTKYCSTDSSVVTPEVRPAGGVFLVNGQESDSFSPSELGTGNHSLTYFPPEASLSNQTGPKYTALQPMWSESLQRAGFWQGFETTDSGKPDEIALRLEAEPGSTVDLMIYEGLGITGELLWESQFTTEGGASIQWHHFALDTAFTPFLHVDSVYTLMADFNGDTLTVNASSPFYGYVIQPSDYDFGIYSHAIRMPTGTCDCALDSVQLEINVTDPIVIDTPEMFSQYCTADSSIVPLETSNYWTQGSFLLNGEPAVSFVPSEMEIGLQSVVFLPNEAYNYGCNLPGEGSFEIVEPPVLDLPDSLCTSEDPFELVTLGLSGSFTLDGAPVSTLEPGMLFPGTHLLEHNFFNPLDTTFWQDTQHFGSGMLTNTLLNLGDTAWQSFVPDSTGLLDVLELYISNYVDTAVAQITLRKGEGLGGEILLSEIDTFYTNELAFDPYFAAVSPVIFKDSVYTVQVEYISGNTPSWVRKTNGQYDPGISNYHEVDGSDFVFSLRLMEIYNCGSMDSHEFSVENCIVSGLEIHQQPGFSVYPNPSTGRVTVELYSEHVGGSLQLFDATGRHLRSWTITGKRTEMDMESFEPGWYVIALMNEEVITSKSLLLH